jgi:hypothetical protein
MRRTYMYSHTTIVKNIVAKKGAKIASCLITRSHSRSAIR